jgi:hypothetical protein
VYLHNLPEARAADLLKGLKEKEITFTLKKQGLIFKSDLET